MRWTSLLALGLLACGAPSTAPRPIAPAPAAASAKPIDGQALARTARERLRAMQNQAALELFVRAWDAGERDDGVAYDAACAAALSGSATNAFAWLDRAVAMGLDDPTPVEQDPDFTSLRADPRLAAWAARLREGAERRAVERHVGEGLTSSTPEAEGIDASALSTLLVASEKAGSSAVVLLRDGKLVGRWYFGNTPHRIEAMSASKSIVALVVMAAIEDGHIPSLDTPVWTWFPEWKQGKKQQITVRMLLDHTSGLQAQRNTKEIYAAPDFVQFALAAELVDDPGARFFYNNKAVNLLPEIVARATGRPFDRYARERLFARMGIEDVRWTKDRTGHPHGMSGLQVQPLDLAKIGQMVLDRGQWRGKPVLASASIEALMQPGPREIECGLLWWLRYQTDDTLLEGGALAAAAKHGLSADVVAKLRPLEGKPMSTHAFYREVRAVVPDAAERTKVWGAVKAGGHEPKRTTHTPSFEAEGTLGQYLFVSPKTRLVAVRMADYRENIPSDVLTFDNFDALVRALTPKE